MKLISIFAILSLSVIVKGAWWTAAVQPVILSLGAVLSTINLDVFDIQLPFISKQDKTDDQSKEEPFSEADKDEKKHNPGFTEEEKKVEQDMFMSELERMKNKIDKKREDPEMSEEQKKSDEEFFKQMKDIEERFLKQKGSYFEKEPEDDGLKRTSMVLDDMDAYIYHANLNNGISQDIYNEF